MKTLLCSATLLAGAALSGRALAAPEVVSRLPAGHSVNFDVMMPLRNRDKLEAFVADLTDPASANFHKWLTPAQFGMRFGPDSASMERVAASLRNLGFQVKTQTRSLHVTGTSDLVERNFGTHLMMGRSANGNSHVMQDSALKLPAEIAATGAQIFSFSPHVAHVDSVKTTDKIDPDNRRATQGPYWWTDLKQAYGYPSVLATATNPAGATVPLDGTGVHLAVLMQGDIYDEDIRLTFAHEAYGHVSGKPTPKVLRVYVNGGAGTNTGALAEASIDTQSETTGAPGSQVVLYDIPDLSTGNTQAGYIQIVEQNYADIVSSSFGGCEKFDSAAYNGGQSFFGIDAATHELFLQGNSEGITFLASSGDSAGRECPSPSYFTGGPSTFEAGIELPAADPAVTAVGGTNLLTFNSLSTIDSMYRGETGWSDPEIPYDPYGVGVDVSGGYWGAGSGYSVYFAQPSYQSKVVTGSTTRRAVPDIGMQVGGCPGGISILDPVDSRCDGDGKKYDGYPDYRRSAGIFSVAGSFGGFIGTSLSSPELAGALAMLVETKGRQGNINPYLYSLALKQAAGKGPYFHTGIPGFNGRQQAQISSTYNVITGVGTPMVAAMDGVPGAALAGTPQTPSNP